MRKRVLVLLLLLSLFLIMFSPSLAQNSSKAVVWTKLIDEDVRGVAMNLDGSLIAFRNPQTQNLVMLNWQQNEIIWEVPANISSDVGVEEHVAWSSDENWIVWILPDGEIAFLDAKTGARDEQVEVTLDNLRIALSEVSEGEHSWFTDVAWNSISTQLAVMSSSYIVIFDLMEMRVQHIINLLIVPSSLHDHLSSFAWSPDGETFAALHFRLQDYQEVFPLEVVMGFWDRDGRWLREYETSNAADIPQNCIANGEEIWNSQGIGLMGGIYEWSPDSRSLAVSERVPTLDYSRYSICMINGDGTLDVSSIAEVSPLSIHWSSDQAWLYAITVDCTLYRTALEPALSTETVSFGNPCNINSAAWSHDDRFIVLGTQDGLWIGELNR